MSDREEFVRRRVGSLLSGIRFGKFVSVGVVGAAFDTAVLVLLSEVVGAPKELAWVAGVETAIIVMFLANEHWTFADHAVASRGSLWDRLKRSHVVRAGGVATQFVVFEVVYRGFHVNVTLAEIGFWRTLTAGFGVPMGGLDVWLLVAKGAGIGLGMLVNYVFESLFTWRVHE